LNAKLDEKKSSNIISHIHDLIQEMSGEKLLTENLDVDKTSILMS